MTFLSLVHPDLPIFYGKCAWRVLCISTNAILDDNEAPACLSPPFGAKFHDGTQNDTQIDQYCAPLSSRSSYNKNNDNNKGDDVFSIERKLKNLHLLLLDHPESCATEQKDACEVSNSVCMILSFDYNGDGIVDVLINELCQWDRLQR